MTIEESNRLIAEFMEWIRPDKRTKNGRLQIPDNYWVCDFDGNLFIQEEADENNLAFHSSWDWLMPVVEKIEQLYLGDTSYKVLIGFKNYCVIVQATAMVANTKKWESSHTVDELNMIRTWRPDTKIEAVYIAVCKFIQWYNENKDKV